MCRRERRIDLKGMSRWHVFLPFPILSTLSKHERTFSWIIKILFQLIQRFSFSRYKESWIKKLSFHLLPHPSPIHSLFLWTLSFSLSLSSYSHPKSEKFQTGISSNCEQQQFPLFPNENFSLRMDFLILSMRISHWE